MGVECNESRSSSTVIGESWLVFFWVINVTDFLWGLLCVLQDTVLDRVSMVVTFDPGNVVTETVVRGDPWNDQNRLFLVEILKKDLELLTAMFWVFLRSSRILVLASSIAAIFCCCMATVHSQWCLQTPSGWSRRSKSSSCLSLSIIWRDSASARSCRSTHARLHRGCYQRMGLV